ncbi:MAG: hypothetical protein ACRC46_15135 [Thermoguttaceae bacterium]
MTARSSFPRFALPTLPTPLPTGQEFQKLSDRDASDPFETKFRVSFWQYARALQELDAAGKITARAKQAIRCLFDTSSPLCADDIKDALGATDKIAVQGAHGLGGFGGVLIDKLNELFALGIPRDDMYTNPDTKGEVLLSIFITFIHYPEPNCQLWFNLRPDFRAALAQCFDMTTW